MSGNLMNGADAIWLDDDEMAALDLDGWSHHGWSKDDLVAFANRLSDEARAIEAEARAAIAGQHRRRAFEPWMQPLLERELDRHPKLTVIRRVLPLADDAVRRGHTLLYVYD